MRRKVLSLILALSLLLSLGVTAYAAFDSTTARHGVARIYCGLVVEGDWDWLGRGSGFFVGKNGENPQYFITNYHVVSNYVENGKGAALTFYSDDGTPIVDFRLQLRVYFDETNYEEAYIVDYDETADFAILRLAAPTDQRSALPLMIPTEDMVSDTIYTVGFPGAADNPAANPVSESKETDATVNTGTISRLVTESSTGVENIQTNAVIQPGNSGGPMVHENGAVIGINTWYYSGGVENIFYAGSVSNFLPALDRNSIPYVLVTAGQSGLPTWAIIAIIAGVVVIAAVLVLVLKKGKKRAGRENAQMSPTAAPAQQPAEPKQAPSGDSGFRVQGVAGALEGKRTLIPATGSLVIGRNPQTCGVVLPENTPGVSGRHCALWVEKGEVWLKDLGSTHGTFVAPGSRLAAEQPVKLKEGDLFWLGSEAQSFVVARKR